MIGTVPSLADLQRFKTTQPGNIEAIIQPLYDHVLYPAAGVVSLQPFSVKLGDGQSTEPGAVTGTVKTLGDTNMQAANQLPRFEAQLIDSIEVELYPGGSVSGSTVYNSASAGTVVTTVPTAAQIAAINDIQAFRNGGRFSFVIQNKPYLDVAPLRRLPASNQPEIRGISSVYNTNTTVAGSVQAASLQFDGRPFFLDVPLALFEQQTFQVTLSWGTAQALPSGNPGRVGVYLNGVKYRTAQ